MTCKDLKTLDMKSLLFLKNVTYRVFQLQNSENLDNPKKFVCYNCGESLF